MKKFLKKTGESLAGLGTAAGMMALNSVYALADVDTSSTVNTLKSGDSSGGVFSEFLSKATTVGSDAYTVVTTLCVICLLLCVAFVGISLAITKNSNKREDNKSWLMYAAIGGCIVFGAGTVVEIIAAVAHSI